MHRADSPNTRLSIKPITSSWPGHALHLMECRVTVALHCFNIAILISFAVLRSFGFHEGANMPPRDRSFGFICDHLPDWVNGTYTMPESPKG